MTDTSFPRSASGWADFLLSRELPSLSPQLPRIVKLLEEDRLTFPRLAEQLGLDPVLAYQVLAEANHANKSKNLLVKHLVHAISLLGTERVRKMGVNASQQRNSVPSPAAQILYAEAVATSLFAARYAQALSPMHQPTYAEELYWSALMQQVPLWYLSLYAEPLMKQLPVRLPRWKTQAKEVELFGCSLAEIIRACHQRLHLPELARDSLKPLTHQDMRLLSRLRRYASHPGQAQERVFGDRELAALVRQPAFPVMLANAVAGEAMQNWYGSRTLKLLEMSAVFVHQAFNHWVIYCHQMAADLSRDYPIAGAIAPASRLFWNAPARPRKRHKSAPAAQIATETAAAATQETEYPLRGDGRLFNELLDAMQHHPQQFKNIAQLMTSAARAAHSGIGLERAVIALVNQQRTRLKAFYAAGTGNAPELANFDQDLTSPNLFRKLLEKPAGIWLRPSSSDKVWAMVPASFLAMAAKKEFFLMSVFTSHRPVAVVYADAGPEGICSDADYYHFKRLCGALATALQHISQKRPSKPAAG